MPGTNDPDIVTDLAPIATRFLQDSDAPKVESPAPPMRTLGAVGTDALMSLLIAAVCFGLLHPLHEAGAGRVVVPAFCLMLSTIFCFFERGLYTANAINSFSANWKLIGIAWVQAVAMSALLLSFPALAADPAESSLARDLANLLHSPWLPAVLVGGMPTIVAARLLLRRCVAPRALRSPEMCEL